MNFFSDYKNHVKDFRQEETCDYLFYRPLAFIVFKAIYKLPVTPNHISLLGLSVALASAYQLALGTKEGWFLAGVGILIFSILDCVDGMVARAKKNGSVYGEQIDMFVDLMANLAFFSGLYIGLGRAFPETYYSIYLALCLISIFIHTTLYNFYKRQFFFYRQGNIDGHKRELDSARRRLTQLSDKKGYPFERILLYLFIKFNQLQSIGQKKICFKPEDYLRYNKSLLPLWAVISGSTHLTVLSFSLILGEISLYFIFALLIANTWMLLTYIVQRGVNQNLRGEV